MAEEYYDVLRKEREFLLDIDKNKVKMFSIGQDYTFFNPELFEKTHNENVQSFFINLLNYIAENKLYDDDDVMTYLYGQIAHFALDSTLHPYIYSKEKNTRKTGFFSQHTTTEYFIDDYLTHKKYKIFPDTLDYGFLNGDNLYTKNLEELINDVYSKTYKESKTSKTYKKTLVAIKSLIKASKLKIGDKVLLKRILKYEKYFRENKIDEEYFLNRGRNIWTNPFSGKISTESFEDLYKKAINKAIELTKEANDFLYRKRNIDKLVIAFPNISYDTGIDCKYGKSFKYLKRSEKKCGIEKK